jgi:hypothetical protein
MATYERMSDFFLTRHPPNVFFIKETDDASYACPIFNQ